jgi:phosphopantetheinyl transferase (holo-ACP synthase)
MATTSFLWSCDPGRALLGCGVDIEKISRFSHVRFSGPHPFPFVFSKSEIDHCRSLRVPAMGLCASFCGKEALFKARGAPYHFPDCECFLDESTAKLSINLSGSLEREARHVSTMLERNPLDRDEIVVTLLLFA